MSVPAVGAELGWAGQISESFKWAHEEGGVVARAKGEKEVGKCLKFHALASNSPSLALLKGASLSVLPGLY